MNATQATSALPAKAARLLATEVLLAEPEALGDDVLESCLYILRDRLRDRDGRDTQSRQRLAGIEREPSGQLSQPARRGPGWPARRRRCRPGGPASRGAAT